VRKRELKVDLPETNAKVNGGIGVNGILETLA